MSNKIMIVGTGNVGASIAFSIINQRTSINEIVLTDINSADAEGEAMDLCDALSVAPSYTKITAGTYADAKSCDVVVITAGIPQKPGETRMELLNKNAKIIKSMTKEIMDSGFDGIFLVVSNPMDVLTYLVWKYSGLPQNRVIGSGTVLDSARLRTKIAKTLNLHPKSVHAYQVGEHGDTEFALWSSADAGGEPISSMLSEPVRFEIENATRNEAYEIIQRKGATYYGIGVCIVHILNTIFGDEHRILSVSSYDDNFDVFYGFPTVIGRRGVCRRLNLTLSENEGIALQKSINTLKNAINQTK